MLSVSEENKDLNILTSKGRNELMPFFSNDAGSGSNSQVVVLAERMILKSSSSATSFRVSKGSNCLTLNLLEQCQDHEEKKFELEVSAKVRDEE